MLKTVLLAEWLAVSLTIKLNQLFNQNWSYNSFQPCIVQHGTDYEIKILQNTLILHKFCNIVHCYWTSSFWRHWTLFSHFIIFVQCWFILGPGLRNDVIQEIIRGWKKFPGILSFQSESKRKHVTSDTFQGELSQPYVRLRPLFWVEWSFIPVLPLHQPHFLNQ